MIEGARDLYFSEEFAIRMADRNPRKEERFGRDEMQMQLWTVIDGDIYVEEGEHIPVRWYPEEDRVFVNEYHVEQTRAYKSAIDFCLKLGKFPKKIQFWTHSQ